MTTVEKAREVLSANRSKFMSQDFVEGVSVSMIQGEPVILVSMNRRANSGDWLPNYINGVKVVGRETGRPMTA